MNRLRTNQMHAIMYLLGAIGMPNLPPSASQAVPVCLAQRVAHPCRVSHQSHNPLESKKMRS
jgi:hypothetical protein